FFECPKIAISSVSLVIAIHSDIVFFTIVIGFVLLFGSIIGAMMGLILESLFGHWMFWPGFVLGEIFFVIFIWEKFNESSPSHNERLVSPLVLNRRKRLAKK
ncbi:MAG: hypothetical protein ACPLKS_08115, partial [Caldisericum exile]